MCFCETIRGDVGDWRKLLPWLVLLIALSACGSSSPAAFTTASPSVQLPSPTAASRNCPTAATVGAALGITVNAPVGVQGGGGQQLPAGAKGIACNYSGKSLNVIIIEITNIDPSNISKFSTRFPVPYMTVSGVGDQARSFVQPLSGGKDNEGVVATKGTTLIAITATFTAASLGQVEALVNQLL